MTLRPSGWWLIKWLPVCVATFVVFKIRIKFGVRVPGLRPKLVRIYLCSRCARVTRARKSNWHRHVDEWWQVADIVCHNKYKWISCDTRGYSLILKICSINLILSSVLTLIRFSKYAFGCSEWAKMATQWVWVVACSVKWNRTGFIIGYACVWDKCSRARWHTHTHTCVHECVFGLFGK